MIKFIKVINGQVNTWIFLSSVTYYNIYNIYVYITTRKLLIRNQF